MNSQRCTDKIHWSDIHRHKDSRREGGNPASDQQHSSFTHMSHDRLHLTASLTQRRVVKPCSTVTLYAGDSVTVWGWTCAAVRVHHCDMTEHSWTWNDFSVRESCHIRLVAVRIFRFLQGSNRYLPTGTLHQQSGTCLSICLQSSDRYLPSAYRCVTSTVR